MEFSCLPWSGYCVPCSLLMHSLTIYLGDGERTFGDKSRKVLINGIRRIKNELAVEGWSGKGDRMTPQRQGFAVRVSQERKTGSTK